MQNLSEQGKFYKLSYKLIIIILLNLDAWKDKDIVELM
jgi:hypothetical protein